MNKRRIIKTIFAVILCLAAATAFASCQSNKETLLEMGQRYLDELDYEKAVIAFEQAIETEPMNEQAYLGLYNAYCSAEEYEKAGEALYRGYKETTSKDFWNLLKEFENADITVSHKSGYYEDGIDLTFTAGKGAKIYYNIGVGSKPQKKYTAPLKLDDGLYHVVVQAKGRYTGSESEIYEYEYIAGPVPKSIKVAEEFGPLGEKYSWIFGICDGVISVRSRKNDLWGTTDIHFKELTPLESEDRYYSFERYITPEKYEKAIKLKYEENDDGTLEISWLGTPICDRKISYEETLRRTPDFSMYWEKIIPFADEDGKLGVMNILGDVILEPCYTGMTNADNGMIIATGKEGTVRLEEVYE